MSQSLSSSRIKSVPLALALDIGFPKRLLSIYVSLPLKWFMRPPLQGVPFFRSASMDVMLLLRKTDTCNFSLLRYQVQSI